MKVAIPTRNNVVDDHFGHCEYYTIFTISEDKLIVCTEIQASPEGCGCKSNIASVLEEKGVELMLAGNMGEGAKHTLEDHHIRVIRGCSGSVEAVSMPGYKAHSPIPEKPVNTTIVRTITILAR